MVELFPHSEKVLGLASAVFLFGICMLSLWVLQLLVGVV